MTPTKVCPCFCAHPFQDQVYGKGMRLHNQAPGKGGKQTPNRYRCTVCKSEKTA